MSLTDMKIFRARKTQRPEALIPPSWSIGALGGFTFLVCYLRSFHFPNVPFLLWGDALGYATKGVRILGGEWPYRDFFDFVTPGTELVYAIIFRWIGVALWVPNLLMCFLATLTTFWVTLCARRLVRGNFVLLPGLLMTGFVLAGSFDATHHWFSTLFVMVAVAVLLDGISSSRVLVAGALCGLAGSFTQSKGAAVLLALLIYLWWKSRQGPAEGELFRGRALHLCLAALLAFTIVNLPFLAAAGLHRWSADLIVFPLRYFGSVSANNWHVMALEFSEKKGLLKWVCLPFLYIAVPVAYSWTFVEVWKRRKAEREEHWDQLMLLALAGAAMLIVVAPSLSMRRISCASPPAMILLVWLLSRKRRSWQIAAGGLAAISAALVLAQAAAAQLHHADQLDLPAGHVAIADARNAKVYRWMAHQTHPGQWYFGMPPYTLPLALKNPTPIEAPAPGDYSRPEQIAAILEGLERTQTKLLLLRPPMYIPHLFGYKEDHLQPFHDYLFGHYRRTRIFTTGDEVWERIRLP
ncbi:MAG: hypothetical protein JO138_26940 [Acidobacteriaceae bacterium]|nr:hypothetical protein [Acidobacteriaceae bacterium]